MENLGSNLLPPLLTNFLLTAATGFLIGLGLREYHLATHKEQVFGSTRTCVFISLAGFVLFQFDPMHLSYLAGLFPIGTLLGLYYWLKMIAGRFGMISILIALLCYLLGPISLSFPNWFLVLFAMTVLLVLNAKPKIAWLTARITNDDLMSLTQFLVLAGVILPLTPDAPIASFIPVTPHQTWLAVVVISGISFGGYLLQTYAVRDRGLLLAGAIGGLYSSTATTVAIARQSRAADTADQASAAIILASAVMFIRLLAIAAIFKPALGLKLLPVFGVLAALLAGWSYRIWRKAPSAGGQAQPLEKPRNPLELGSALIFALLFVVMTALTQWVLQHYAHSGLLWLSGIVGFTDIDPFVLSLVQGSYAAPENTLAKALAIAASSNNILKAIYAWLWSNRKTGRTAAGGLIGAALLGTLAAVAVF